MPLSKSLNVRCASFASGSHIGTRGRRKGPPHKDGAQTPDKKKPKSRAKSSETDNHCLLYTRGVWPQWPLRRLRRHTGTVSAGGGHSQITKSRGKRGDQAGICCGLRQRGHGFLNADLLLINEAMLALHSRVATYSRG